MKQHYSHKYCLQELIDKYCSDEWKYLIDEKKEVHTFIKEERIFKEGEVAKYIKVLKKGRAKVHTLIDDKNEKILRLAGDRQVLGHRAFGGDFRYSVSATALSKCEVLYIPLNLFMSVLKANSEFCFHFMMFMAEELKNTEEHSKLNGAKKLTERVAAAILDNLVAYGYDKKDKKMLSYTISRKDYAGLANTTYESIVRTFKTFDDMGVIRIVGKKLEILNEKKLIELSTLNY